MKSDEIKDALQEKLLPEIDAENPEDELHRFVVSRIGRFECPSSAGGWSRLASRTRRRFLREVYLRGHPEGLLELDPEVEWRETIQTGAGYRIRKLLYTGYPGMWIPALLYEPDDLEGEIPAVMNPNGHHIGGKAMAYKQARCINLVKRGMLALSTEFIGMGELSMNLPHDRIAHMDLCGRAGVGVFYLAAKRGLDVLLSHPNCDHGRVAVTGLSGGGWQTIVLSALDERVTATVPVAGHSPVWQRPSSASDIGDLEQTPTDICTVGDYDTLTALCAPRPTLLIYNRIDDCCFRSDRTRTSIYEPVRPLFELLGVADEVGFYENTDPGTHNYEEDNRSQLYRFLNQHFGLETPESDLPFEDELLSESQLSVGVPEDNPTLLTLAREAARGLPLSRLPEERGSDRREWVADARNRLGKIIHIRDYSLKEEVVYEKEGISGRILRLGGEWSVPLNVFGSRDGSDIQILLSDNGRAGLAAMVEEHLSADRTVVAADLFGMGESRYEPRYQMLVSAVGERPLGILTGQILSLLEWSRGMGDVVLLSATGVSSSIGSLCAAALEPGLVQHLRLEGLQHSLKRLIELPVEYGTSVPIFCFGLLREFDVPELIAMTDDLEIERPGHGPVKPIVN